MFELPPFRKCPRCKNESLGTLSVGDTMATKRCKDCRYSHGEVLPDVDKRVVYLDQFVISELYKTKTKTRRPGAPSEQFWLECYSLANRAYLRQQVIFPTSNLHSDETIVWHSPSELRLTHEMFSGDISFEDTRPCSLTIEPVPSTARPGRAFRAVACGRRCPSIRTPGNRGTRRSRCWGLRRGDGFR